MDEEAEQYIPEVVVSFVGKRFAERHGGLSEAPCQLWSFSLQNGCPEETSMVVLSHLLSTLPVSIIQTVVKPCHEQRLVVRTGCCCTLVQCCTLLAKGEFIQGILERGYRIKICDCGCSLA